MCICVLQYDVDAFWEMKQTLNISGLPGPSLIALYNIILYNTIVYYGDYCTAFGIGVLPNNDFHLRKELQFFFVYIVSYCNDVHHSMMLNLTN